MRRLVQTTVALSFLVLSGCVFSALDKQVEDALGTLDDAALATADEALRQRLADYKSGLSAQVLEKARKLQDP